MLMSPQWLLVRRGLTIRVSCNSQETLVPSICISATIVAEPIRLQNRYEECSDDVMWA